MSTNFVHGFFLKSGDSINAQPNRKLFNAKAVNGDKKLVWDNTYVKTPFTLPSINNVIVSIHDCLLYEAGTLIK